MMFGELPWTGKTDYFVMENILKVPITIGECHFSSLLHAILG